MTEIEKKALALLNEVAAERAMWGRQNLDRALCSAHEVLCRAIEQHEAFRQEVSDSLEHYLDQWRHSPPSREVFACQFGSLIIAKPDPLVEALAEYRRTPGSGEYVTPEKRAEVLRAVLAARGLKIVEDRA